LTSHGTAQPGGSVSSNAKVWQVTDRLWQGSIFAVAREWDTLKGQIDIAFCMGEPVWSPPSPDEEPPFVVHTIADNPAGCDCLEHVQSLVRGVKDKRVLFICAMGENRSGLAAALWLIENGLTPDAAITLLREKVKPNTDQPHVLWNPGFERQVRALA